MAKVGAGVGVVGATDPANRAGRPCIEIPAAERGYDGSWRGYDGSWRGDGGGGGGRLVDGGGAGYVEVGGALG